MNASLNLRGAAAGYGARTVFWGLHAEFPSACVTALLGPGGSGKSTLLRAIEGSTPELWRSGGIPRVRASLLSQPDRGSLARTRDPRLVALARVHVELWLDVNRGVLSAVLGDALLASEPALLRVSNILAADTDTLLLDEPDAWLDPLAGFALMAIVRARARAGATVVLVTHNLALLPWVADRVVLMVDGVKLDEGALGRVRTQPASPRVREFFAWGT